MSEFENMLSRNVNARKRKEQSEHTHIQEKRDGLLKTFMEDERFLVVEEILNNEDFTNAIETVYDMMSTNKNLDKAPEYIRPNIEKIENHDDSQEKEWDDIITKNMRGTVGFIVTKSRYITRRSKLEEYKGITHDLYRKLFQITIRM